MGKEEPTRVLRIVAKRNGFRRAGRAWSTEPRDVALDALSAEELAQLRAEPMLIVTEVEIAPPAGSQPAGERDGGTGAAEGAASLAPGASGTGAADPDKFTPESAGGGDDKGAASADAEPAATGHAGDKDAPPKTEPMAGGGDAPSGAGSAAGRRGKGKAKG